MVSTRQKNREKTNKIVMIDWMGIRGEENLKDNSDYIWSKNTRDEGVWLTTIIFSFFLRYYLDDSILVL